MKEIADVRGSNGLKVVSTFSGCGGSCLGFEMAGFDVVWASEFVELARQTYELNHPGVTVDGRDIRKVEAAHILEAIGMEPGELDVLEGSPPCASFSMSGRREKTWGTVKNYSDKKQRTDDLFFEFIRLVEGIQPRVFVAENVAGLVRGVAFGYFKTIMARMKALGYRVSAKLLDAKWLGVPQARRRVIFVGVREDLKRDPVHPKPFPYTYALKDAVPVAARAYWDSGSKSDKWTCKKMTMSADEPMATICAGSPSQWLIDEVEAKEVSLKGTAIGAEVKKLDLGGISQRYQNLVRTNPDKPVNTITAGGGPRGAASVVFPCGTRKFTIAELMRLCAFPEDFQLLGNYAKKWERMGRSVPPIMMFHIARTIRDELLADRVAKGASEVAL